MALSGIVLNQYYLQPSCSPSRACFHSGRYPLHTGINNFLNDERRWFFKQPFYFRSS